MNRRERKKQQKKKQRQERLRQEKHLRHAQPGASADDEFDDEFDDDIPPDEDEGDFGAPRIISPLQHEQLLQRLQQAISERGITTEAELQALMEEFNQAGPDAFPVQDDPKTKAQNLAYQAMESRDPRVAEALAREALQHDPDCVDALATLAGLNATSVNDLIKGLEEAVQAGERSLGAEFFANNKGRFWGILETRPYMRTRAHLADLLCEVGHWQEAISHFEAMLELNPNDNQGIRDSLLGCYLATGNLAGAQQLFERYGKGEMAVFAWGRVLERFLSGQLAQAADALKKARTKNPFAEAYLIGSKPLPHELLTTFTVGKESEGMHVAAMLEEAWRRHPQALHWLKTGAAPTGSSAGLMPNLFANEHSQRWIELLLADKLRFGIVDTLHLPESLPAGMMPNEKTCWEMLTAAEIVAAGRGRPSVYLPIPVLRWLRAEDMLFSPGVISLAQTAVSRVWSESELANLWKTSGELPRWRLMVEDLQSRLGT